MENKKELHEVTDVLIIFRIGLACHHIVHSTCITALSVIPQQSRKTLVSKFTITINTLTQINKMFPQNKLKASKKFKLKIILKEGTGETFQAQEVAC